MKKLIIIVFILGLALPAWSQVSTYGTIAVGSLLKSGGDSQLAFFVGTNTKLMSDSAAKFVSYNRTGYFYADGNPGEVQSLSTFLITQKSFSLGRIAPFVAMGGGLLYQIEEGEDGLDTAIKFEVGATIYKAFSIAIGADYVPIKGEGDETFVYGLFNIFPF